MLEILNAKPCILVIFYAEKMTTFTMSTSIKSERNVDLCIKNRFKQYSLTPLEKVGKINPLVFPRAPTHVKEVNFLRERIVGTVNELDYNEIDPSCVAAQCVRSVP